MFYLVSEVCRCSRSFSFSFVVRFVVRFVSFDFFFSFISLISFIHFPLHKTEIYILDMAVPSESASVRVSSTNITLLNDGDGCEADDRLLLDRGKTVGSGWKSPLKTFVLEGTTAFLFSYGLDYALHNQYCNLIFQCGCTWRKYTTY